MKRIGRSLFIIVSLDVGCWLLTPIFHVILKNLDLNSEDSPLVNCDYWVIAEQQTFVGVFFISILLNFALAIKLLVYYLTR